MSDTAPIGSLIAYGGLLTANIQSLHAAGWLPCDGTAYAYGGGGIYDDLQAVIKSNFGGGPTRFNVPDMRGQFARGVNNAAAPPNDPDNAARLASAPGGNTGNKVGSQQSHATALPTAAFTAEKTGAHTHTVANVPNDDEQNAAAGPAGHNICHWNTDSVTTDSQGSHTHTLSTGGDSETRPSNIYMNWFIKYKNS